MTEIRKRMVTLVEAQRGIKASRLCAEMATTFWAMKRDEIRRVLISLIEEGKIIELEYTIGHLNDSLLLPKGSEIRGISNMQDLGDITVE